MLDWLYQKARFYAVNNLYLAEDYIDLHQEIESLFVDIDRIYLDKKQVLQTAFIKVSEVIHD